MKELAKDMTSASSALSQKFGDMMSDLAGLVSALENIEVEKEQSTMQRILGWLEGFFNGLVKVFSCGLFIVPLVSPRLGLGILQIAPSLSKLCREAAKLCKKASENHEEKEPKTVEDVLLFLKKTVPEEAREAREILAQFDKAFVVRGLEEYMERVRTTTLPRSDLVIIAQEWSNVAGRYESTLVDCQNPLVIEKDNPILHS